MVFCVGTTARKERILFHDPWWRLLKDARSFWLLVCGFASSLSLGVFTSGVDLEVKAFKRPPDNHLYSIRNSYFTFLHSLPFEVLPTTVWLWLESGTSSQGREIWWRNGCSHEIFEVFLSIITPNHRFRKRVWKCDNRLEKDRLKDLITRMYFFPISGSLLERRTCIRRPVSWFSGRPSTSSQRSERDGRK